MTKVRVHELAKELNKSNKEILDFLQEKKVEVKSHMSSLTDIPPAEHTEWKASGRTKIEQWRQ